MTPTLAAIRFGTGLSPDIAPPADAAAVMAGLDGEDAAAQAYPLEGWVSRLATAREFGRLRRARDDDPTKDEAFREIRRAQTNAYHDSLRQTLARAARTEDGFRERLHWFWADHFTVADGRGYLYHTVAGYHEDAIRPHITGHFADLLIAAVTHPAMLVYLDQTRSMGPNSPRGRNGGGLNENLARELLELHTLGVGGPYNQGDVGQLAELLTGLSIEKEGAPRFRRQIVEPGAEVVLGRSYGGDEPDRDAILQALRDLSVHPATARHICRKLAVHFVTSEPPEDMVATMSAAWLANDGALRPVYAAMLDHPAAWAADLHKVRRPLEFVAAALRAGGAALDLPEERRKLIRDRLTKPLADMGQIWLRPSGPDGWPEDPEAWITPQGLAARLDWSMGFGAWLDPQPDPRDFVEVALGPLASPRTLFAADAAEDRAAGIGLILATPEFQRR